MKTFLSAGLASLIAGSASAAEMTVQNDSLTNFGTAVIQAGFVVGEKGASWLTSPCDGNIVAVQIFWLSASGGTGQLLGDSIGIHRSGTFPTPGALAQQIQAPLLTDGVINEYRYLDDNNTVPLIVPVTNNETFVVAYTFSETPALYTAGGPISHTITISNAGPGNAPSVIVVDAFPAAYTGTTWLCAASGGATCTSGGSGNISQVVNLPLGSHVTYTVNATVAAGTTGILSNSVTAVVNTPATDPDTANNTATANTAPESDRIFASGFDPST